MMRQVVIAAALVGLLCPSGRSSAAVRSGIIPRTTANRHGLARPWFTQVQMDRSHARVRDVVIHWDVKLHKATLYVQTDRAMLHAIDAETGETVWARQVGRPNHPSMTPGVSQDLLGLINGSRLYVCNRDNGDLLFEIEVDGAPGAGACLSEKRAYVPMVDGLVMAYRLESLTDPLKELYQVQKSSTEEEIATTEEDRRENLRLQQEYIPPLACQSLGRALVQPLVTRQNEGEEYVAWPTDRGFLNIGRIDRRSEDRFSVKYRLETEQEISARPTYLPPDPDVPGDSGIIYAASRDGFVHAIQENSGESFWRFSTGEPIQQPAVVIGEEVFVATQPGGMYCLDAKTGKEKWWAPRVKQFIAASKQRVYVADRLERILILDAKTGARLDSLDAVGLPIRLINSETDRLYLATETGLIQCLHELELAQPIPHGEARRKAAAAQATAEVAEGEQPPPGQQPAAGQAQDEAFQDPFKDAGGGPGGGGAPAGGGGGAGGAGGVGDDPLDGAGANLFE